MKNLYLILLILFSITHQVIAQQAILKKIEFGLRVGVNVSHMNFSRGSPQPEDPIEILWQTGGTIGIIMSVPIKGKLYFQPEYNIVQTGGEIEAEDLKYNLYYLSLPVLLKWKLNKRILFLSGPQIDVFINGKMINDKIRTSLDHKIDQRSIGVISGIEYSISKKWDIGTRFLYGIDHIGVIHQQKVQEFQFEMFQLAITYRF